MAHQILILKLLTFRLIQHITPSQLINIKFLNRNLNHSNKTSIYIWIAF